MKAVAAHDTLLFNLKTDPGEKENLLAQNPKVAQELITKLKVFQTHLGEVPPGLKTKEPADRSHYDRQEAWLKLEGK
ncbi:MAG: hypothetical protein HC880_17970, partial [Bacteroidia bacterium]|nr:hypothetical protein [Bacteroidia bacterium]